MTTCLRLLATTAALASLAIAGTAEAALALRAFGLPGLSPLGTVVDGDAGDAEGTAGSIANNAFTLAGFSELQLSALGPPFLPGAILGGGALVKGGTGGQVRVEATLTDIATGSPGSLTSFFVFIVIGAGSATMTSYISASNLAFATDTQLATRTFSAGDDELFSTPVAVGTPYSQTIVFDITLGADSQILVAASVGPVQPVPEPASLALLGAGLLGLGLARRRRR